MDQMAQSLGYSDGAEMVNDQLAQRAKTQDLERRLQEREERDYIVETSTGFLASAPDFPNTDASIAALEQVITTNGWEWNTPNMQAAHALAVRNGLYQPLSAEQQNVGWEQNLRESNRRPTPPPMLPGKSPDAEQQNSNPYAMPLQDLRQQAIRQALGETDGRR
jgi:hypothetical protein